MLLSREMLLVVPSANPFFLLYTHNMGPSFGGGVQKSNIHTLPLLLLTLPPPQNIIFVCLLFDCFRRPLSDPQS